MVIETGEGQIGHVPVTNGPLLWHFTSVTGNGVNPAVTPLIPQLQVKYLLRERTARLYLWSFEHLFDAIDIAFARGTSNEHH